MFDLIDTAITGDQFLLALHDTLIMVAVSLGFGALIGVPLGIVLVVCRPGGIVANPVVHQALNPLINVLRSLPFIILLIVILPFTRLLVGTTIGTAGAIVPLIVFVAPYIARLVESSLLEVDEGILEAADAMGATPLQTVWHFMLPEAAASLILALTTATIGLLGATAMAGTVGGGGIGDLAITYGYQRFDAFATLTTALVLIVIVQLIQTLGTRLAQQIGKITLRLGGLQGRHQRDAHGADAGAHGFHFFLPQGVQRGSVEHLRYHLGAKPRRAGVVAPHGGFQLAQHAPGDIGIVADH